MQKIKNIILLLCSVLLFLIPKTTAFAASPANYGFEQVPLDEVSKYGLDSVVGNIYFYDKDGTIWHGMAINLFEYLKDNEADSINSYVGGKWDDVSRGADKFDAITLSGEMTVHDKGSVAMIAAAAYNVMELGTAEAEFVVSFYKPMMPLCVVLICLYAILATIRLIETEQFGRTPILKQIALVLGVTWLCTKLQNLCYLFYAIYNSFLNWAVSFQSFDKVNGSRIYKYEDIVNMAMQCDGTTFWDSWTRMAEGLLYMIMGETLMSLMICLAIVLFYAVHIAMALRCVFLPIAVPALIYEGRRGKGMSYLRGLLACSLEGGAYVLIMTFASNYESTFVAGSNMQFSWIMVPFGLLISLMTVRTFVQEFVNTTI